MTATPRVSVLLTAYNRESYVGAAIESVLAQTCGDFELIICDDRSTDGTADIVADYARREARIRFSVNAVNLGDYENRFHAATLAQAPYLKYHDSDDLMYPHCLAAMLEPLEREPRAAFALSAAGYWPGGACPMLLTPQLAYEREFLGSGLFQLGPASALFRTSAFRELGGFPRCGPPSDFLFWIKACAKVNVLLVSGDLYYYRVHAGQVVVEGTTGSSATPFDLAFANASAAAWAMLNSAECPLRGAALDQAKRNFLFTQVRGAFRQARRGRVAAAATTLKLLKVTPADWARYLRRPRRSPFAGTPIEAQG